MGPLIEDGQALGWEGPLNSAAPVPLRHYQSKNKKTTAEPSQAESSQAESSQARRAESSQPSRRNDE